MSNEAAEQRGKTTTALGTPEVLKQFAGLPPAAPVDRFISVIVPVLNDRKHIGKFLSQLHLQTYPKDKFEVLIADGGSSDGTLVLIQQYIVVRPETQIRLRELPGASKRVRLNHCVREARGEIIARIDGGHSFPSEDYLERVNQYFWLLKDQQVLALGGPVRMRSDGFLSNAIGTTMNSRFAFGNVQYRSVGKEGFIKTVQNASYLKAAFDELGLFDDSVLGGEDDDFHLRIIKARFRIFMTPAIRFFYYPRETLRGLFHQQIHYGRARVRVIRKHPDSFSLRYLVPPLFVAGVVAMPILCVLFRWMRWPCLSVAVFYLLVSIISALDDSLKSSWRNFPIYPCLYFLVHVGYGLGILVEVFHIRSVWDDSDVSGGASINGGAAENGLQTNE